jgi:hypothetical protein
MVKTILVWLSLGLIYGFWLGISIGQPELPEKLPTKVVRFSDSSTTRYFLIGYNISNQQRGNIEWVSQSGKMPNRAQLLESLHNAKNVDAFKDKDFIIMGIYEFKNEAEMNQLSNN